MPATLIESLQQRLEEIAERQASLLPFLREYKELGQERLEIERVIAHYPHTDEQTV